MSELKSTTTCIRKKQFIDPEVQGALTKRLVLHWLAFASVAAAIAIGMQWMSNPFAPMSQVLAEAWWTSGPVFLVLLCMLPIFVVDSMKLSNRFAGPLVRFRKAVNDLAEGREPESMEFRHSDFWRDMASDLNLVAKRVETQAERPTRAIGNQAEEPLELLATTH
jgi:hypothetical protein